MAAHSGSTNPFPQPFSRRQPTNPKSVPISTSRPGIESKPESLSASSSTTSSNVALTVSGIGQRGGIINWEKVKKREERERKEEVNRKIASQKAISVILRREATKAIIEQKRGPTNSKKLLPRTVLEALHERITALRWESALKVGHSSSSSSF